MYISEEICSVFAQIQKQQNITQSKGMYESALLPHWGKKIVLSITVCETFIL